MDHSISLSVGIKKANPMCHRHLTVLKAVENNGKVNCHPFQYLIALSIFSIMKKKSNSLPAGIVLLEMLLNSTNRCRNF